MRTTVYRSRQSPGSPSSLPASLRRQRSLFLAHQRTLYPGIHLGTTLARKLDSLAALQELPNLGWGEALGLLHTNVHPSIASLPDSVFSQAHLALETEAASGSSCIGQFC